MKYALITAPLAVRQAARTIAARVMPMAALPTDPELGPMLPLHEALRILASDKAWLELSADGDGDTALARGLERALSAV